MPLVDLMPSWTVRGQRVRDGTPAKLGGTLIDDLYVYEQFVRIGGNISIARLQRDIRVSCAGLTPSKESSIVLRISFLSLNSLLTMQATRAILRISIVILISLGAS